MFALVLFGDFAVWLAMFNAQYWLYFAPHEIAGSLYNLRGTILGEKYELSSIAEHIGQCKSSGHYRPLVHLRDEKNFVFIDDDRKDDIQSDSQFFVGDFVPVSRDPATGLQPLGYSVNPAEPAYLLCILCSIGSSTAVP